MDETNLTSEERDIIDSFERNEMKGEADAAQELEDAKQAARNTFNKTRRVNLRVTERDYSLAHSRAREEGIPYQTLLSSVVHKYLSGRLVEKQ
ncbi:MAG: antitoxin [Gemmatimonadetes bacterium]|jgi:predicted DNA binding CopG/RHH family protein|nr:antitoxin [Gemmatimonadota bacterium]MBT6150281.1 antitoxin [Gemmatimonadota bacterium]MBT7862756.1 antitoxin [Gemmatimonadota bacterium]